MNEGWISFENGKLQEIGNGISTIPSSQMIDDRGMYLAPGFDLHVHRGHGKDFLTVTPEGFITADGVPFFGGTTVLCPTAATVTYKKFQMVLDHCERAKELARTRIMGVHLEGPHLSKAKAGALDTEAMRPLTPMDINWVIIRASQISQITVALELPLVPELIQECNRARIVTSAGYTENGEPEMEAAMSAELRKVTHLFNAMASASKKGLFREAGRLELTLSELMIVCELISDRFHVVPRLLKLAYQAKGANRIALVSDAFSGAGLPVGFRFRLEQLQCRVGNGFCLLEDNSALAGSLCRMIDLVRVRVQEMDVPLVDVVRMASLTPVGILRPIPSVH